MVKYSISKTKLTHNFKNLKGVDTSLRIDKQGRNVSVVLVQGVIDCGFQDTAQFVVIFLIFLLAGFAELNQIIVTHYVNAVFVIVLLYQFISAVHEESLIMVHSVGYQVTSKSLIRHKDLFIPWNQVQSIFVNEVIIKHKVIHLLTIMTKDHEGERLFPVFLQLQPRLQHLDLICKHLRGTNS